MLDLFSGLSVDVKHWMRNMEIFLAAEGPSQASLANSPSSARVITSTTMIHRSASAENLDMILNKRRQIAQELKVSNKYCA
jgi:hypothetical protein